MLCQHCCNLMDLLFSFDRYLECYGLPEILVTSLFGMKVKSVGFKHFFFVGGESVLCITNNSILMDFFTFYTFLCYETLVKLYLSAGKE